MASERRYGEDEVREILTDSYRKVAPKRLAAQLEQNVR